IRSFHVTGVQTCALPIFGTMLEGPHGAHRMQTAYQAAEHQQMVGVVQLRCAAAETAKQAEAEPGKLEQGASIYHHRRYDRDVPRSEERRVGKGGRPSRSA